LFLPFLSRLFYNNNYYIFFNFLRPLAQSRKLKQCTKQGMTATASNRSQRCWRRPPQFSLGGGYWQLLK